MLLDDGTAVYADDFAVGIGFANDAQGLGIEVGLCIGRYEYGAIDNQIVGVGGWQALCLVIDRMGQGKLSQPIGLSLQRSEGLQLLFHQQQVRMLFVTTYI